MINTSKTQWCNLNSSDFGLLNDNIFYSDINRIFDSAINATTVKLTIA